MYASRHADHAEAHNNLVNELVRQGKLHDAVEHYSRALEIQPDCAEARQNLELVLNALKRGQPW
jgi:tetratricopeptide (TPR) repeat protein